MKIREDIRPMINHEPIKIPVTRRPLKAGQYYAEVTEKNLIIGHFSASDGTPEAVGDWFDSGGANYRSAAGNTVPVATAYSLGKDGKIIEMFDPEHWAVHLGSGLSDEQRSIGIELVNAGPLRKRGEKFFWWPGNYSYEYTGRVYDNITDWRGFRYFAAFPVIQVETFARLTAHLIQRFKMNTRFVSGNLYLPGASALIGFAMHCNFRADKFDLGPAFQYEFFKREVMKHLQVPVLPDYETL